MKIMLWNNRNNNYVQLTSQDAERLNQLADYLVVSCLLSTQQIFLKPKPRMGGEQAKDYLDWCKLNNETVQCLLNSKN